MKCKVIKKINLTVDKGSIVEIEPFQYEIVKEYLEPIKQEQQEPKQPKKKSKK